jgi:antitoxin (DNA-binding transcriptional repressor) of toxin-antitoxin stability system
MRSVDLKVLKNKLSEYVQLAADGETVLVTDRDSVVAELAPPRPGRSHCAPMLCWPMRFGRDGSRPVCGLARARRHASPLLLFAT